MLQDIRADIQELLPHCVFGDLLIFSINAKGFGSEEKVLRGWNMERLWEKIGQEFAGNGI